MANRQAILIIEDDDTWRTILKETLQDEGYDVTAVANYQQGRQTLEKHLFDLVLLDLELDRSAPMLQGERLLRWLSQHHPHTPCIIVSGKGDVRIVRNAFKQYRVVDFIAKDKRFDILVFVETVKDTLRQGQPDATGDSSAETITPPVPALNPASGAEAVDGALARATKRKHLTELLQVLVDRFDTNELRTLCFHLGVDYEDLPGEGKTNKARDLVRYLDRRNRVPELIETVRQLRPDVAWEHLPN